MLRSVGAAARDGLGLGLGLGLLGLGLRLWDAGSVEFYVPGGRL